MADLAAGVAGLLSLTIQITQVTVDYVNRAKKASVAVNEFRQELVALATVLKLFGEFLKGNPHRFAFEKTSVLYAANSTCEQQLGTHLMKLEKNLKGGKFTQAVDRLTWPFVEKEHDSAVQNLHRYVQIFQFALNVNGCELLSQTSDEVSKGLASQIKTLDDVNKNCAAIPDLVAKAQDDADRSRQILQLISSFSNYNVDIDKILNGVKSLEQNAKAEKINQWLAAPLPSSNHNTAMKKKQLGTGEWFLKGEEFADWKIETSSFIWLHGIPGCGKTILCSTIIQDVISHYQSKPTVAVVYFYFDFNDSEKQSTEKFIRSLMVQLSAYCPHIPDSLQSAYSQSQNGKNQLTTEELTNVLHQMVKIFKSTYILIDALDECKDLEDLLEFIKALMGWNIDSLHVLATSRKENDIAEFLDPLVTCQICIQSALVDADIHVHILERLQKDSKLKRWPISVQKEIEDALMREANGMFRWVVCQLDSLRKCLKLDTLRKALKTLPKTLDDTYERILSNIDEEYTEDAIKVFNWLCFSARPMRLDELVEVLATDLNPEFCFKPEQRLPDPRDILTICSTLISITAAEKKAALTQTTETQELRLAHFSVKEYLISDRLREGSMHRYHITPVSANVSITETCLTYLLHFDFPTISRAKLDREFPFVGYAAHFWPWHYRQITNDADRGAVDFLGCSLMEFKSSRFTNWMINFRDLLDPWQGSSYWLYSRNMSYPPGQDQLDLILANKLSPLYLMCYLGVSGVVQVLLNREVDINAKDRVYENPLLAASDNGYEKVVRLLLGKVVGINSESGIFGDALSAASSKGHQNVVQLLLEKGADVNFKAEIYDNALSTALCNGHDGVVQLILENEKGANVNAKSGNFYGKALTAASLKGREDIVRFSLGRGANINPEDESNRNPLSAASSAGHKLGRLSAYLYYGHEGYLKDSLSSGDYINAEGEPYGNALSAASYTGRENMVRLLLEEGVNVNADGGCYGNALSAASFTGHVNLVRLLLEKGADVNAEDRIFGKALSAASNEGHEGVLHLLLEKGANVNAEGEDYRTALSAASYTGRENLVRLLLEKGANVNAGGGKFGNALSAASYNGHEGVLRLLLEKGANVNAEGGRYGNALSAASCYGREGVIRILLENGANVNAEGGRYGSALAAASSGRPLIPLHVSYNKAVIWRHEKTMRLLLEKGADVNAQSGLALRTASQNGHRAIMRVLLENEADASLVLPDNDKALLGISVDDHEAVIQLLVEELGNPEWKEIKA